MGVVWARRLACIALLAGFSAHAAAAPNPEQQFTAAVEQLRAGRSSDALTTLEALTRSEPNFHLAQLFYGELLSLMSGAGNPMLTGSITANLRLRDLAEEARVRLASEKSAPQPGMVPNALLKLADNYKRAIVVDLPRARLYVLSNEHGKLTLERHHYAAMGRNGSRKQTAGALRTPVGLYHATHWIGDGQLSELYGSGALPLDYPNAWDQLQHRTGSGIWLHGVPRDTFSRPPRSSEGCVTMANADLEVLRGDVEYGMTPVVLSDEIEWVPAAAVEVVRDSLLRRIEDWRKAWSSKNTDAYLAYYAQDFSVDGMNLADFSAHKRRVNASKKFIDVRLSDISLFRYPGTEDGLLLAEFTMDYGSDNYKTTSNKQQFWRRDAQGNWKIVREINR